MKMNLVRSFLLVLLSLSFIYIKPVDSIPDQEEDFDAWVAQIDKELEATPELGWWEKCTYAYQLVADKANKLGIEATVLWYRVLRHLDENKVIYSSIASTAALISGVLTYYFMKPKEQPVKPAPRNQKTTTSDGQGAESQDGEKQAAQSCQA